MAFISESESLQQNFSLIVVDIKSSVPPHFVMVCVICKYIYIHIQKH